jgi:hypothetical protein
MADFTAIHDLQDRLLLLEADNRTIGSNTNKYLAELRALIGQTDEKLQSGGPAAVGDLVKSSNVQQQMDDAITTALKWTATDEIVGKLQSLQADLNELPAQFPTNTGTGDCSANIDQLGWSDWSRCRDAQYKAAQAIVSAALTEAGVWTSDGDKAAQLAKKIGIVQYWKSITSALSQDSFTLQSEVPCGVLFNRNEQTILKLLLVDRTSVFDGQPGQAQVKDGVLTVTCSSPFRGDGGGGVQHD